MNSVRMYEVTPKSLWIGNAGDLYKPAAIELAGIKAIVQVALAEQLPALSRELMFAHFPIMDGSGNARGIVASAVELTVSLIRERIPTMVCCSGGMSRSPCIMAGALAIVQCAEPESVMQQIIAGNPHDVSPGLWQEVCAYVQRSTSRRTNT